MTDGEIDAAILPTCCCGKQQTARVPKLKNERKWEHGGFSKGETSSYNEREGRRMGLILEPRISTLRSDRPGNAMMSKTGILQWHKPCWKSRTSIIEIVRG